MYEQKDSYQKMYEQCVTSSLEKLASNFGNYEMKNPLERMQTSDFPVLKY